MKIQMIGRNFGRLKVIKEAGKTKDNHIKWLCLCACGGNTVVDGRDLRKGSTTSCGCYSIEKATERVVKFNTKHGECYTRLYRIWNGIHDRCNRKNSKNYRHYGGRGIKVCEEWNDYLAFKTWALTNGYEEHLTIDRINVDGNYEPTNCRWITKQEQQNNKRTNRYIMYNGLTLTVTQWNKKMGYKRGTIENRLLMNWDVERAILEKPFVGKNQNYKKTKKDIDYQG